ncbi:MAG TPA: LysR family transcriptional regulator, partial [Burkholderiaceae bacterium]|nr:LysR family transcriptional regulator [Burkholderiaceae bacterium]
LGITLSPMYVGVAARGMGLAMKRVEEPEIVRQLSLYLPRRSPTPAVSAFAEFLKDYLTRHQLTKSGQRRRSA